MLNQEESNIVFKEMFKEFNQESEILKAIANSNLDEFENIIPRHLRLFEIRLRLCIGIEINFNTKYALVKNENVKETYVHMLKCNEAWFAYEAMKKYATEIGITKSSIRTPVDIFTVEKLNEIPRLEEIIVMINKMISSKITGKAKIQEDITNHVDFLTQNMNSNRLKEVLGSTKAKLEKKEGLDHKELLAIVYAARNVFVHKGETAKSGIKYYNNKIKLLKILYDYIILMELALILFFYKSKIQSMS
jgi:hypothetical protein